MSLVVADSRQQQQQQRKHQQCQATKIIEGKDKAEKQQWVQQQEEREEEGEKAGFDCDDEGRNITSSNNNDNTILSYNHISDFAPFFEVDAHWEAPNNNNNNSLAEFIRDNHDRLNRRIFNTHLRWDMLPKDGEQSENVAATTSSPSPLLISTETDATTTIKSVNTNSHDTNKTLRPWCGKFIYVTRNLPDVCASFYHHLSNQKEGRYLGNFTTFFHDWMDGNKIPFGSPLHHFLSFAEGFCDNQYSATSSIVDDAIDEDRSKINQCQDQNHRQPLLLLSYEKMKTNLRQEVLKIIDFLRLDNISMQVLDEELLPTFGFQFMKKNADMFQPKSVTWLNGFQFLRRGEIGDGTKMLLMENTSTIKPTTSATESTSDEDVKLTVTLMDLFCDWVDREKYCQKISELESHGLAREASDQFLAVVHGVCGKDDVELIL